MNAPSPYMTLAELAAYVRLDHTKDPLTAASRWVRNNGIKTYGRGRVLVLRHSVDEALKDGAKVRRAWKRQRRVSA